MITVRAPSGTYDVLVAAGVLQRVGTELSARLSAPRAAVVTDETVGALYAEAIQASLSECGIAPAIVTVPAGEKSKSLHQAGWLYDRLADQRHERHEPIVALGGGVVGDLAGFVAATWMRGVPWVPCPTTLEAMIDASVGGKTAVNLPGGKNLVGAFHQPVLVCADPDCLSTLPRRDYTAGLAESVKHAVVADAAFFDWHERHVDAVRSADPSILVELIAWNCRIKAAIVAQDEREQAADGLGRAALNFGHTIGHALEAESDFALRHGEAVALGMIAEMALAEQRGGLASMERRRVEGVLASLGLPITCPIRLDAAAVLRRMAMDKKSQLGTTRFVVPERMGSGRWLTDANESDIGGALTVVLP